MFLGLVILSFFFHIEGNQVKPGGTISIAQLFTGNPLFILLGLIGLLTFGTLGRLAFVLYTTRPLLYSGRYAEAQKAIRPWTKLPGLGYLFKDYEGNVLLYAGRYVEAEVLFRSALDRAEKADRQARATVQGNLGWALLRQARYQEAQQVLDESIQSYSEGSDNFNALGELYLQRNGDARQALQYLERGIHNKRYAMRSSRYVWGELLANRAWAQARLGDGSAAKQSLRQAFLEGDSRFNGALAGLHYRAAQVMALLGDLRESTGQLERAVRIDPDGAFGQLAASQLASEQDQAGSAEQLINTSAPDVARAIRDNVPHGWSLRVVRENVLLVAKGPSLSYVYLLRALAEGGTRLRLIVQRSPIVETALATSDLKAAMSSLLASVAQSGLSDGAALHLAKISHVAQGIPQPVQQAQPEVARSSSFTVKPLPAITAASPQTPVLSPSWWAAMSIVGTPIVSGIALAYYWRKLGKPAWMWPTLTAAIALPVVAIGAALGLTRVMQPGSGQTLLVFASIALMYGFVVTLGSLQEQAYQKWKKVGWEAAQTHQYDLGRALLMGGGTVAIGLAVGGLVFATRPGPQTFDHKLFSLTYPGSWQTDDVGKVTTTCKDKTECFVLLHPKQFAFSYLVVGRFWLDDPLPATDIEQRTWTNLKGQLPAAVLESRDRLTVGGYAAARRFNSVPNTDRPSADPVYSMQIFINKGRDAYFIIAWSDNKAIFDSDRTAIDGILASLVWKLGP